jgi:lipoate-protein ligase A
VRGPFRLLLDGCLDGASNMAVDEAVLESYVDAESPPAPTLRLYSWDPPAVSLGRRQPAAGAHDAAYLRDEGIELVRRPTGGRAVLHEHERTYAVIGRLGRPPFDGGVLDTYRRIAAALVAALRLLGVDARGEDPRGGHPRDPGPFGPPVCFDRAGAHEITAGGRKLVGSAQLRRHGAFLQHGSLPLRADPVRLSRAIGAPADASRFVDLRGALGRVPDTRTIDAAIAAAFTHTLGVEAVPGSLTSGEAARAAFLRVAKYSLDAWNLEGREPGGGPGSPRR